MCRGSVFCFSAHSSPLLCLVFYALYTLPLLVIHPCVGLAPASPTSTPPSASKCLLRSTPYLLPSSHGYEGFLPHSFQRVPLFIHIGFFRDVARYLPFSIDD
ncbi:unnamed protein product [Heterobilharzia americana]|nr:unnamed protein product [Heterobilharzia americana]